jgi:hypothetical protein
MEQAKCATGRGKEETRNTTPAGKAPLHSSMLHRIRSEKNEVRVSNLGELARRKSMEGKLGFGMGTCKEKKNGGKIGFRIWRNL